MSVSSRYVLSQGPMLATLGRTAVAALAQRARPPRHASPPATPSPEIRRSFAPPPPELLDAYIKHVGGDPRAYRGLVPPHFFPHWVMPVAAATLAGVPYPLLRILNAGCRMQIAAPLPRGERLRVRAQLASVDDDGRRVLLTQRVITGTDSQPDALTTDVYALVPLSRGRGASGGNGAGGGNGASTANGAARRDAPKDKDKDKARVPQGSHEIGFEHLDASAGLSFAKLTGDFNPIHWLRPYARASGFKSVILHGFATFARACEALNRGVYGGDVLRLKLLDAKFTRPLSLPHDVGYFVRDGSIYVGDAMVGPAYMIGRYEAGGEA